MWADAQKLWQTHLSHGFGSALHKDCHIRASHFPRPIALRHCTRRRIRRSDRRASSCGDRSSPAYGWPSPSSAKWRRANLWNQRSRMCCDPESFWKLEAGPSERHCATCWCCATSGHRPPRARREEGMAGERPKEPLETTAFRLPRRRVATREAVKMSCCCHKVRAREGAQLVRVSYRGEVCR